MTTINGDLTFDPMCVSGTTGAVCQALGVKAILSDISEEYTQICEKRLDIKRLDCPELRQYICSPVTETIAHTLILPHDDKQTNEIRQMQLNW